MGFDTTSEITFRKLSIFMTFMEKGNIARTAETLGLSGVSVHRALHTLEENVRCPLFAHKGRNLIALRVDAAGVLSGGDAGDGARAGRVAQDRRYRRGDGCASARSTR